MFEDKRKDGLINALVESLEIAFDMIDLVKAVTENSLSKDEKEFFVQNIGNILKNFAGAQRVLEIARAAGYTGVTEENILIEDEFKNVASHTLH